MLQKALDLEENKEYQTQRTKVEELENQLKEKEDYINFLTERPPFESQTTTPISTDRIKNMQDELAKLRKMGEEVRNITENNKSAMNEVWPHLMNVMINQCKKAEQLSKKYKALTNERQILINEIGKLKAKS